MKTIVLKMVILKYLQVKFQTTSYFGQPPIRKETFSTEHIKTSLLSHFIINKTYLIQNFITTHVY